MTQPSRPGTFKYFCEELCRFRELIQSDDFWDWPMKRQALALQALQKMQWSLWNRNDRNSDVAYMMLVTHVDEYWTRKRLERKRFR